MFDRKVLLGIGIGMVFATIAMYSINSGHTMSKGEIEEKAYHYGMKYPNDMKVIK
ncbi:hypothetical protein [Clostridium guangxiense]|uniref:hypothetical protein n=1 Tax=Clostridium guangxiense TaxID=1662055 RepID=UPI001E62844E|nr:hypothetical protein [Clostridium guangxiense]MCD2345213.1 hypothetical protein [Clostridium guangxiense]